ncbi:MAG: helix-turn-helix domain-containing protein [Gammaproteobacteria bacterium]|nr:helix-turn-helix domain-containing protein [Gammaproteobacteria bacterium]
MKEKAGPWFSWGDPVLDNGFVMVPNGLLKYQAELKLTPAELNLILQAAAFYRQGQGIIPSMRSLAVRMGLSERQTRRIATELTEAGYLELIGRHDKRRQTSNEWRFHGLIRALRTYLTGPDTDVTLPPDTDVTLPPDTDVIPIEYTNKEYTNKEQTRLRLSRNSHVADMQRFLGFPEVNVEMCYFTETDPVPNPAKEGKFVKKMMDRGFPWEEIFECWRKKVVAREGQFVSMQWVNEDIGKKEVSGNGKVRGHSTEADAARLAASIGRPLRDSTARLKASVG